MFMTANQVLRAYWDNSVPIDPIAISNKAGIKVFETEFTEKLSGIIWKNPENKKVEIYVNKKHSKKRQRFTIAHELGHFFADDSFDGEISDDENLMKYRKENSENEDEISANHFASQLLMPKHAIDYMIKNKIATTIEELAERFNVSLSAMNFRLIALGYISG